jgi:signal transduction histidine kinase
MVLANDSPTARDDEGRARFLDTLSGFTDPFAPEEEFTYGIYPHSRPDEDPFLAKSTELSVSEFEQYEHTVKGLVRADGSFYGVVKAWGIERGVFETVPVLGPTCGPFELSISTLEVDVQKSSLPRDVHALLRTRIERLGGVKIYRDGLRLQPFGRIDSDFFEIETRRNLHAGREYWAERRMFGRVAISRTQNPKIRDKAGREGLIETAEVRQLKKVVTETLKAIARRFFGTGSDVRNEALASVKIVRDREAEQERLLSAATLRNLKLALSKNAPQLDLALERARELNPSAEDEFEIIEGLKSTLALPPAPRKMSPVLEATFRSYRDRYAELVATLRVKNHERQAELALRRSPDETVQFEAERQERAARASMRKHRRTVETRLAQVAAQFDGAESRMKAAFEGFEPTGTISDRIARLGEIREHLEIENDQIFGAIARALDSLLIGVDLEGAARWAADERESLGARALQWEELAQVGIVVEIIGHELSEASSHVFRTFRNLPQDIKALPSIQSAEASFTGLVRRLEFLAPLKLSGRRMRSRISGARLASYLETFFEPTLASSGVELSFTTDFRRLVIDEFEYRIFPVFVNLLNNAIFWAAKANGAGKGIVVLDATERFIVVSDNGPGVDPDDVANLFSLYFSKKVGGRGVGLYLSKLHLEHGRHRIRYGEDTSEKRLSGANFVVELEGMKLNADR